MLPEQFLCRMEKLLGGEYSQFLESYDRPRRGSLRVNLRKGSVPELADRVDFLSD
ncbi:MAG: RNA methyltransferase, partial [Lachnospiraceae bacterium]|nr:RNA methyltransferase [Lachnospiraceae bacterium]